MRQLHDLIHRILEDGVVREDRTGTGTIGVFGHQSRYDLRRGFPLQTTRALRFQTVVGELLWMISGSTSARELKEKYGVGIWAQWADADGELGPVYGYQWRRWPMLGGSIDQLRGVIQEIRQNPESRRLLVLAWNVEMLEEMRLPPCHFAFQFYVANGRLSCQVYQRSADVFVGVPHNVAFYALLTHCVARVTGLKPGELVHTLGDAHLYLNHVDAAREVLARTPAERWPDVGIVKRDDLREIDDFRMGDFTLTGYDPHPAIKVAVAV